MPNDSRSRRDKKEKEKKRKDKKDPRPLSKELPAEEAEATSSDVDGMHSEEALAISVSLLGAKPMLILTYVKLKRCIKTNVVIRVMRIKKCGRNNGDRWGMQSTQDQVIYRYYT